MFDELRKCKDCLEGKPSNKFYKKPALVSGFDKLCKKCRYKLVKSTTTLESRRNLRIKKEYGIDLNTYKKMCEKENNLCRICKKYDNKLYIDHCHKTNKIRGLLCDNCNKALGLLYDNIVSLERAVIYLRESEENVESV